MSTWGKVARMLSPRPRRVYADELADATAALALTEQRLRVSEALLDHTGGVAGIGGWQLDLDTHVVSWSAQMKRIHDAEPDYQPTFQEGLSDYLPPSRVRLERAFQDAMETGVGWDLLLQLTTQRGRDIWVRSVCKAEFVAGRPTRLVGSTQDITDIKEAEKSLNHERDLMASLLEALPDQIYFKDRDSRFLRVNAGMARRHGFKLPAEVIGKSEADFFPDAYAKRAESVERQIMQSGEPVIEMEEEAIWPDRSPTWSLTTKMPLYDAEDHIVGTFGISRDITARKGIESQLHEAVARFAIAADSAGIGVWDYDPIHNTLHWDDWMYRIYGVEPVTGPQSYAVWVNALHPEDRERCEQEIAVALRGRKDFDSEFRIMRPGGEIRYLKAAAHTLRAADGTPTKMTGVNIDVTERCRAALELREAIDKAENANRAKSQFLANMSHEIRTPMNAVIGLSYLLAQTGLNSEQRDLLSKIQFSSNSLLAVINDVLDLTKIEANELIVESTVFDPRSLVQELSGLIALDARAKGITFDVYVADGLPAALQGDATRLRQVLTNLLSNAVKFTDSGGVTLHVSSCEGETTLCFVVRDTGIGISTEAQKHLFAPFAQADASITRRYGGTGLGLSIVKRLVNLLGGDVLLKSTPGVGSEFTVTLTFAPAPEGGLEAQTSQSQVRGERSLGGLRILVVDDSDINLEVTRRILELHGARVELAGNGLQAFERLRQSPQDFDVVLMDVQMPVLDGYEATERIRTELGLVDIPIIALTAGALSSERQRAMTAGMDDFIVKPFNARTLAASIERHCQIAGNQAATPITPVLLAVPEAVAWPLIDGIDPNDARERMCDDFALFRSSLRRLLDEFCDVDLPVAAEGQVAPLTTLAARMHKLTGTAGMIGAHGIARLAADTRTACVAGEVKQVQFLVEALAVQLQVLRRSAAPMFDVARIEAVAADEAAAAPQIALHPKQLTDLIHSLREQSLAALDGFADLSSQLRQHLGRESFESVRAHVESLRFMEAAAALEESTA